VDEHVYASVAEITPGPNEPQSPHQDFASHHQCHLHEFLRGHCLPLFDNPEPTCPDEKYTTTELGIDLFSMKFAIYDMGMPELFDSVKEVLRHYCILDDAVTADSPESGKYILSSPQRWDLKHTDNSRYEDGQTPMTYPAYSYYLYSQEYSGFSFDSSARPVFHDNPLAANDRILGGPVPGISWALLQNTDPIVYNDPQDGISNEDNFQLGFHLSPSFILRLLLGVPVTLLLVIAMVNCLSVFPKDSNPIHFRWRLLGGVIDISVIFTSVTIKFHTSTFRYLESLGLKTFSHVFSVGFRCRSHDAKGLTYKYSIDQALPACQPMVNENESIHPSRQQLSRKSVDKIL
jgi:hypothetical protein